MHEVMIPLEKDQLPVKTSVGARGKEKGHLRTKPVCDRSATRNEANDGLITLSS